MELASQWKPLGLWPPWLGPTCPVYRACDGQTLGFAVSYTVPGEERGRLSHLVRSQKEITEAMGMPLITIDVYFRRPRVAWSASRKQLLSGGENGWLVLWAAWRRWPCGPGQGHGCLCQGEASVYGAINQVRHSNYWVCSEDVLLSGLRYLTHNSLRWKRENKREKF